MSFLTIEETEDTLVLLHDMPVTMNIGPDDEDEDEDDDLDFEDEDDDLLDDAKEISIEEIDPIDFDDDDDDDLFDDDL
jgi:hypothetical protein